MAETGTRQYQRRRRGADAVALADREAAGLDPPCQHADDSGRGRGRLRRGQPYGTEPRQKRTASRLGLEPTFRPRGRPSKQPSSGT
jgi:hypothetical protein